MNFMKRKRIVFQFPSNGKAYPKRVDESTGHVDSIHVSIPFKRESLSKVEVETIQTEEREVFQFPSNGKAYPKDLKGKDRNVIQEVFQFPSNGKAYPKLITINYERYERYRGFNSLQTGKPIQRGTIIMAVPIPVQNKFQFPSNGKAYPKRIRIPKSPNHNTEFQFPSNGKAYPKSRW